MTEREYKKKCEKALSALEYYHPHHIRIRALPPNPLRLPSAEGKKRKAYDPDDMEPSAQIKGMQPTMPSKKHQANLPRNMDVDDGIWTGLTQSLIDHWTKDIMQV
ncbi:hypothetical protein SLS60_010144 [Paraconiothyrium brasiliense]|uniref:Uncharacterized protein n=1 Tax=Paraconiothyrium brasiliense TaxID=300254 RepID=A0ABR3QQE4_9PLEO